MFLKSHYQELQRLDQISKVMTKNIDEVYKELMHLDQKKSDVEQVAEYMRMVGKEIKNVKSLNEDLS